MKKLTLKKVKKEALIYRELKNQEAPDGEYFYAFSQEQFDKGLLEIRKTTNAEVFQGSYGMIGTKKGIEEFNAFYSNRDKRIKEQCTPIGIFYEEYQNHEGEYDLNQNTAEVITKKYFPNFSPTDYADIIKQIRKEWLDNCC